MTADSVEVAPTNGGCTMSTGSSVDGSSSGSVTVTSTVMCEVSTSSWLLNLVITRVGGWSATGMISSCCGTAAAPRSSWASSSTRIASVGTCWSRRIGGTVNIVFSVVSLSIGSASQSVLASLASVHANTDHCTYTVLPVGLAVSADSVTTSPRNTGEVGWFTMAADGRSSMVSP